MPFLFVTTVGIFYHLPYFRVTVMLRNLVTEPVNGRAGASSIEVQLTPHMAMASLVTPRIAVLWAFNTYASLLMFNLYQKYLIEKKCCSLSWS